MKKLMEKEGKIDITIAILLIIILIAGVILTLKITGIIKPAKIDSNITIDSSASHNNKNSSNNNTQDYKKDFTKTIKMAKTRNIIITIFILIAEIGINIGICKLYQKLQMPKYIIIFTFIWPILGITQDFFTGVFEIIFSIVYSILQVASLFYYFKSTGMSGIWAFVPTLSTLLLGVGSYSLILGGGGFLAIIGIGGLIACLIAYVISNIKLGEMFNKGTGFKIGLAILPFIFQPILGYSND